MYNIQNVIFISHYILFSFALIKKFFLRLQNYVAFSLKSILSVRIFGIPRFVPSLVLFSLALKLLMVTGLCLQLKVVLSRGFFFLLFFIFYNFSFSFAFCFNILILYYFALTMVNFVKHRKLWMQIVYYVKGGITINLFLVLDFYSILPSLLVASKFSDQ